MKKEMEGGKEREESLLQKHYGSIMYGLRGKLACSLSKLACLPKPEDASLLRNLSFFIVECSNHCATTVGQKAILF